MQYVCAHCQAPFQADPKEKRFGKTFCCRNHYDRWRVENARFNERERRSDYQSYKRAIWGGSGKGANEVGAWAKAFGRQFEQIAQNTILPAEGFMDIDNWSEHSNQFLIDLVATKNGERVLVDVTAKWSAHVPQKVWLAESLRMPLFILHVSPANPASYHLANLRAGQRVSKVPMSVFHALYEAKGLTRQKAPAPSYLNGERAARVTKACEACGVTMRVPRRLGERKRFCSRRCAGTCAKSNLVQFRQTVAQLAADRGRKR